MKKKVRKNKMTIDKLAIITQKEFHAVRKEMQEGLTSVRKEMHIMKNDIVEEVSRKVIQSNDKLATKIDLFFKETAAHDSLHHGITDKLLDHETRLRKVETKIS